MKRNSQTAAVLGCLIAFCSTAAQASSPKSQRVCQEHFAFCVTFPINSKSIRDFNPPNLTGEARLSYAVYNWYRHHKGRIIACSPKHVSCQRSNFILYKVTVQPNTTGETDIQFLVNWQRDKCTESQGGIIGMGSATLGTNDWAVRDICQLNPFSRIESITATHAGRIYTASVMTVRQKRRKLPPAQTRRFFSSFGFMPTS